jgi:hypothetical protein
VHYVRRGRFRVAEPLPDHRQATLNLLDSLPVHGLAPTTVRELLSAVANALAHLEYAARKTPERRIGDRNLMMPWYVTYAAQAKAFLVAGDRSADLPVPASVPVTGDDWRGRFLALVDDGRLMMALDKWASGLLTDDDRAAVFDDVRRLADDMKAAGVVRAGSRWHG